MAIEHLGGYVRKIFADLAWLGLEAAKTVGVMLRLMLFYEGVKLARSASERRRYEGHGYIVWAVALWIFAVLEVKGSLAGKNGRIPTLSGTVGNLINGHDWISVFVVGLLFFGVAQVARTAVPKHRRAKQQRDQQPAKAAIAAQRRLDPALKGKWTLTAAESGRATTVHDDKVLQVYWSYEVAAILGVEAAFLLPYFLGASKQVVGESGYATLFFALFLVPGVLAYRHRALVPFPGLFTTMLNLEKRSKPLAGVLGAGLVFLAIHLTFYPFPSILPDIQGLHHHCSPAKGVPMPAICRNPAP